MDHNIITHTFAPVYDKHSRILILGTIPSKKSRELGFYYSHPQNRFWKVLAALFDENVLDSIDEKICFLLSNHIAVWDVLASCNIHNSDDSSIKNSVANDFSCIYDTADIKAVFTNGKKATDLYQKFCVKKYAREANYLPSTSPANCAMSLWQLTDIYRKILTFL